MLKNLMLGSHVNCSRIYIWKHVIGSFLLVRDVPRAYPTRRAWDGRPRARCVQPQSEGSLCGLYPHAYVPLPRATMVYESYSLAAYLAADRSALPFLGAL
jgi:hypothetical protein